MMGKTKVLMLMPRPKSRGGVTHFCEVILKYGEVDFRKHHRGRTKTTNAVFKYFVTVCDYFSFALKILIQRPDLVHVNTSLGRGAILRDSGFVRISKFFNLPIFLFIHGWEPEYEKNVDENPSHTFRINILKADRIGVLSNSFKSKLLEWGYTNPIDVERTFVGDDLINNIDFTEKPLYRLDRSDLRILFMSRLEPTKGFFELLNAVSELKNPEIKLDIAGTGSAYGRLQIEIDRLGLQQQVTLHGHVSGNEKKDLLFQSDVFALPSYYPEGLPISLLEGMLFGMPLLASTAGGIAEIFIPGKMGKILPSITNETVLNAVREFASMPREKLSETGKFNHQYACENFLGSQAARRMTSLYHETLKSHV